MNGKTGLSQDTPRKDFLKNPCSVDEAYTYCAEVARSHYENFPVASFFLPKESRKHVAVVYAFARGADDLADLVEDRNCRLEGLDNWREMLFDAARGQAKHPVFIALSDSIRTMNLPVPLLDDLLTAFRMDAVETPYTKFNDLLNYSRYSANPIGRLVLHICGVKDAHMSVLSDSICTGLQLTNFWQDIGVDTSRGRLYLPSEEMANAGYGLEDLKKETVDDRFKRLVRSLVDRTRELFHKGSPLGKMVGGGLGFEIRLVCLGGQRILDMVKVVDYDVFRRRPELKSFDKAWIFARALLQGR